MKRVGVLLIGFLFLFGLVGCAGIHFSQPEQDVVYKVAARRVGYEIAKEYPKVAEEIVEMSLEDVETISMECVEKMLLAQIDDELLRRDIEDLLGLVEVDISITERSEDVIKNLIKSLVQGIEVCKEDR